MSVFVVYAGPNGSGKSSLRDAEPGAVSLVIDEDRIARQMNASVSRAANRAASKVALHLFKGALTFRRSMSIETTLTGHAALMRMMAAKAAGYTVALVYVALNDPELNVQRVRERVHAGGHAVQPGTVRRRVKDSLANLPRALALADLAIVLDNSGPKHDRVLEVSGQTISFAAATLPRWLAVRMPDIDAALGAARSMPNVGPLQSAPSQVTPARERHHHSTESNP